jgi:hypothetical protein
MHSYPRYHKEVTGQIQAPAILAPAEEPPVIIGPEAGWTV